MESKEKKSIHYYMRTLHRDLGFFAIGLTIIFSISGIVLVYRDTDFLKSEKKIVQQLPTGIDESNLGGVLRIRGFAVTKTEGDIVYFQNGNYNKATGVATYTQKVLPEFLNRFNAFHKTASRNLKHWGAVIFAILLLFLSISSFWMFKPKSKHFKRGLVFTAIGVIFSIILLFL